MSGQRARLALVEAKKLARDGMTVTVVPDRTPERKPTLPGARATQLI